MSKKIKTTDFIRNIVAVDLENNRFGGKVHTRFPPEPNGYLHIGHAKSIYINFNIAQENDGEYDLRFDDTNPEKESLEYLDAIRKDVKWLGFDLEKEHYASDYFDQLFDYAVELIEKGKAYVCDLSAEQVKEYRGDLKTPGKNSPYRNRTIEENLDLFFKMQDGYFDDGTCFLRAKIDMASPNMNMRDPAIYRIKKSPHHRTAFEWCVYPMYDFAHCLSDSIEQITHSLCTLEFEDHRPLYEWFLNELSPEWHPRQIEFSRLNLEYTVTSKRKLNELVTGGYVSGWDDPRMPTISGMRRRGYTPTAIRNFCRDLGVSKSESTSDIGLLEGFVRSDLEDTSPRVLGVLNPLRVVIENYPEDGEMEELKANYHPKDESMGFRMLPFTRELYIDYSDFEEKPPPGFKRLSLSREVRLRYGYVIRCVGVVVGVISGRVLELRCIYYKDSLGKKAKGKDAKAVIHWVSADYAVDAEVRMYDRLFTRAQPDRDKKGDFKDYINPDSLVKLTDCKLEYSMRYAAPTRRYQFEREGYFWQDSVDSTPEKLVFNRIVTLKDSWGKGSKTSRK
jgi:glutaminyl-tRNA synthetase